MEDKIIIKPIPQVGFKKVDAPNYEYFPLDEIPDKQYLEKHFSLNAPKSIPERWLDYYREQDRLEEPLIAMVDAEGLSEASLEKGMKQMIEEREQMHKRMEKQFISHKLMRNREAAFDPEQPEKFLDLLNIPDIKDKDDDDYEVRAIDLHYEEEEEPEPWASSLPELQDWNKSASESSFDDSESFRRDFEDDPV